MLAWYEVEGWPQVFKGLGCIAFRVRGLGCIAFRVRGLGCIAFRV